MPLYKLKYYCEKCKKYFFVNLHSGFKVTQKDLSRFSNELKQKHNIEEHRYCAGCKKKISKGKGIPRIIGRKESTLEERKKGISFTILFGIFCEKCNELLNKENR